MENLCLYKKCELSDISLNFLLFFCSLSVLYATIRENNVNIIKEKQISSIQMSLNIFLNIFQLLINIFEVTFSFRMCFFSHFVQLDVGHYEYEDF